MFLGFIATQYFEGNNDMLNSINGNKWELTEI